LNLSAENRTPQFLPNCRCYAVQYNDTLTGIARRFGVSVEAILRANPRITNPDRIFVGQRIRVPVGKPGPGPQPACDLRVLTVTFLTETGQPLPSENGAVQLIGRVIVRPTFSRPVSQAFFFLVPTGTETCELAQLIGVDCPSAVTGVAEIIWDVPPGTIGYVFVVACLNECCAKSGEILVVRDDGQ